MQGLEILSQKLEIALGACNWAIKEAVWSGLMDRENQQNQEKNEMCSQLGMGSYCPTGKTSIASKR